MCRRISLLTAVLLLLAVPAAPAEGNAVEFITDITVQERAVAPDEVIEWRNPGESTPGFVIEDASVVESTLDADAYEDLSVGAEGEVVLRIQERLMQLGYLTPSAPDGVYGKETCAAMHDFKAACGIDDADEHAPEDCAATAQAQTMLFSDAAVPYNDPAFPVELVPEAGIQAKEEGAALVFSPTIRNDSHTRTVTSVTLTCYVTDLWGNPVEDASMRPVWSSTVEIAPGGQAAVDAATLPQRNRIAWLYAAITSVTFADGATIESPDPVYIGWTPTQW